MQQEANIRTCCNNKLMQHDGKNDADRYARHTTCLDTNVSSTPEGWFTKIKTRYLFIGHAAITG